MEKKDSFFAKIHRDGFKWTDSMIISFLVFAMMFIVGSAIALAIGSGIKLLGNENNAEFVSALGDNFGFIGYWIIAYIYLLLVKSEKPALRAFGREPKGNTVKMLLWGLLIGMVLNALCATVAILHGDIRITYDSFPVIKILLVFISVFVQSSGEEIICRGVLYQRLRKGYKNPWVAILVSPVAFVIVHMGIPGCTILPYGILFRLTVDSYGDTYCMEFHTEFHFRITQQRHYLQFFYIQA